MKLGEIDLSKKPLKPNLFLCKPDKKTIKKLSEAYDISYLTQLGTVNEITFRIPTIIEKDNVAISNPNIQNIRHRYLFKLVLGKSVEYFIFNERSKTFSDSEEYIEYKAYSLGYELIDKNIRELKFESKNLSEMIEEVLTYTNWKLNYVDSEFDLKYRSHEISSQTVLQVVYDLAEKFNAVIRWNTAKREISLFNPSNVGLNKGLRMKYGKYLESFNLATDSTETITRLKLFGQDGISIRRLSPTGVNYIEDFSWYMYPFEMDENDNVIKESFYMSNSLCISLLNYNNLLSTKMGDFELITNSISERQKEIQDQEKILRDLGMQLTIILDEIDISNKNSTSDTPQHNQLITDRENKEAEIASQESLISSLKTDKTALEDDLLDLQALLKMENNFSPDELIELNSFIIEKEYINDSIVDDEDLLKEGIEAFRKFREPKIDLSIDIVNFLSIVESQNDWDKLVLGDVIRIQHERFGEDIQAKIIEINYSFEDNSISLNIANEREMNQIEDFMQKIYDAGNTSTIVNMDKYKWDLSLENNGAINEIINNKWDALKNAILAGYDQQIEISERGIIVKSLDDPDTWLVIQNGMLAITNTGGNDWKHAITSEGSIKEQVSRKVMIIERRLL